MAKAKKPVKALKKASQRGKASAKPSRKKAPKRATSKSRPRKAALKMTSRKAPKKAPRQKASIVEDTIIDVIDEPVPGVVRV